MKRILILGSGGREHALAYALSDEDRKVVVSPGNDGIALEFECMPDDETFEDALTAFNPDLVVVGPETILASGRADDIRDLGFDVFGPTQEAAKIESSKVFMKRLCLEAGVATAPFGVFTDIDDLMSFYDTDEKLVLKADGLCAGKGVIICDNSKQLHGNALDFFNGEFGEASKRVVVEKFLPGKELSVHAITDGTNIKLLPAAHDYKQLLDGGHGPNTGGMGATSQSLASDVSTKTTDFNFIATIKREVFAPILKALRDKGTPYKGVLYAGLMIDKGQISVLEFNCRFGDPETQAMLYGLHPSLDLYEVLKTVASDGKLGKDSYMAAFYSKATATVALVSRGYPKEYKTGTPIKVEALPPDCKIFYAGVKKDDAGQLVSDGGRVLYCTARADLWCPIEDAVERAYAMLNQITFKGCHYRKDIGKMAV